MWRSELRQTAWIYTMNIILQRFYCRRGIFLIVATKMIDLVLSCIFRSNPTLSARFNSCYYIKLGQINIKNKAFYWEANLLCGKTFTV